MRNENFEDLTSRLSVALKSLKEVRKSTGMYMPPNLRFELGERGCKFSTIAKYYASNAMNLFSKTNMELITDVKMQELSDSVETLYLKRGLQARQRGEYGPIAPGVWYHDLSRSGFALASVIEIPVEQRTPVVAANLSCLASPTAWASDQEFVRVWDEDLTKPIEVVFSDCWDDAKSLVVSATDGLQSMSIRFLASLGGISSRSITVDEQLNQMFVAFSVKIDARGKSPDVVVSSFAKAFGAQEFASEIENAIKHRGYRSGLPQTTMREIADIVDDTLRMADIQIVEKNDTDNLHGNTVASTSDIFEKVVNRFGRDELAFGSKIIAKLYQKMASSTFYGDMNINDMNIAHMMTRFIQTQYQIKLSTLSEKQRDILSTNCAVTLARIFDTSFSKSKDAAGKMRSILNMQGSDEDSSFLSSIGTNHDMISVQFAMALMHMSIGDQLNKLGNTQLSDYQILSLFPNGTNWEASEHRFEFKAKYWGFVAKELAKEMDYVALIDAEDDIQMVIAKTKSGTREMTLSEAEDYGLEYELV